jgi:hypothetical protein
MILLKRIWIKNMWILWKAIFWYFLCLSPLTLRVRTLLRWGVLDTTFCDKFCQWLATGWWFSPVSSTNKTDRHDIFEILLKVTLNIIKQTSLKIIRSFKCTLKKAESTTQQWPLLFESFLHFRWITKTKIHYFLMNVTKSEETLRTRIVLMLTISNHHKLFVLNIHTYIY